MSLLDLCFHDKLSVSVECTRLCIQHKMVDLGEMREGQGVTRDGRPGLDARGSGCNARGPTRV